MSIKLAVVLPKTHYGEGNDKKNLKEALAHADEAAKGDTDIIFFPETYPGPWRMPISWSPIPDLQAKAKEHSVYIIAGAAENSIKDPKRHNLVHFIIDRKGELVGKYRRTSPYSPWGYLNSPLWNLDYEECDELPVFDTEFGKIGMLICSEVYVPELARILALKGAEIIFMPAGGMKVDLNNTWGTLIFARAIENLAYVATTQCVFGVEEGLAMVASPEDVVLKEKDPGIYYTEMDLDRVRWLREQKDDIKYPLPWKTKPGIFHQWRRPELYKRILER